MESQGRHLLDLVDVQVLDLWSQIPDRRRFRPAVLGLLRDGKNVEVRVRGGRLGIRFANYPPEPER